MSTPASGVLRREQFFGGAAKPDCARVILDLLLAQDGSTTRLLEAMTGERIGVHIIDQHVVHVLPEELDGFLPGGRFLRRLTSLEVRGHVLLDSLSYIAVEVLPPPVVKELEEGIRPIGHVLWPMWTRRTTLEPLTTLLQELWAAVGQPDAQASRTCSIDTPRTPCMLLAETFRAGVLATLRSVDKPVRRR